MPLPTIAPRLGRTETRRLKPHEPDRAGKSVYADPRWPKLRNEMKRAARYRCQRCGAGGKLEVDHRIELKDGGAPFDPANLEVLCLSCHRSKTAAEKAKRNRDAMVRNPEG